MKIRSITYFCNPKYPLEEKILQKAGKFLADAKSAYETAGYEVQTVRLATIPFPQLLGDEHVNKLMELTESDRGNRRAKRSQLHFIGSRPARVAAQL
ncbi:MAG: DUF711 family protein [Anaerolineales bacterium]